jgi:outer membrane protein
MANLFGAERVTIVIKGHKHFLVGFLAAISLSGNALAAAADRFTLGDRFNNAIEAVQQGIDVIWPGDLDSESFNARIGAGMGWVPDYDGSDNYRFTIIPILDVRYKEVWRLNGSRFTYSVVRAGNKDGKGELEVGPLVNLHFGRSESDNKALVGLGDIPTTVDVGGFVAYRRKSLLLELDVRQALGAAQGLQVRFTAGHGIFKSGQFGLGLGLRAKYLSKKAMQTNFGITPQQAANSAKGFSAFEAGAGVSEVTINLLGGLRLNDKVRIMGLLSAGNLYGSAADSPLVTGGTGSRFQVIAGTGITLQF